MPREPCPTCDLDKDVRAYQCSSCRMKYNHPRETGKWGIGSLGYLEKRIGGALYLQHRVVMELVLGRPLKSTEVVHHKDGDKQNNSVDNLEIMSQAEHMRHHNVPRDTYGRFTKEEEIESANI